LIQKPKNITKSPLKVHSSKQTEKNSRINERLGRGLRVNLTRPEIMESKIQKPVDNRLDRKAVTNFIQLLGWL